MHDATSCGIKEEEAWHRKRESSVILWNQGRYAQPRARLEAPKCERGPMFSLEALKRETVPASLSIACVAMAWEEGGDPCLLRAPLPRPLRSTPASSEISTS